MFNRSISNEALNEMPVRHYEGPMVLIDKKEDVGATMISIMQCKICGVDTETLPAFRKGEKNAVALMQIATNDVVYLIRINKTGITDEIVKFLEAPDIYKIGIALKDDMKELNRIKPVKPKNVIDLNHYSQRLGFESCGAKKLSALILGFRISKSQQTSNWESSKLSEAQLQYAATDAWVCREIYLKLQQERDNLFTESSSQHNVIKY